MFSTIIKKAACPRTGRSYRIASRRFACSGSGVKHPGHLCNRYVGVLSGATRSERPTEASSRRRDSAFKDSDELVSLYVERQPHVLCESLDRIKAHINRTGEQLAQLQALKNEAAPWQRAAIDRITPIAQELATNTSSAIAHINDSPNHLYSPDYRNTLLAIAEDAREMKNSVSDFLSLAEAQQKVDDLQMKILSNS